ncbi:hypothetical protein [Pseudomonas sp. NPDC096950]|uniref:hypothetical protein n=1 Tax=Pseudomonas sp. NPDC096950 TaxID=3364485 RepID=UPI00383A62F5
MPSPLAALSEALERVLQDPEVAKLSPQEQAVKAALLIIAESTNKRATEVIEGKAFLRDIKAVAAQLGNIGRQDPPERILMLQDEYLYPSKIADSVSAVEDHPHNVLETDAPTGLGNQDLVHAIRGALPPERADEVAEIDFLDVLRPQYESGKGVIQILSSMTDFEIAFAIKSSLKLSKGRPVQVFSRNED